MCVHICVYIYIHTCAHSRYKYVYIPLKATAPFSKMAASRTAFPLPKMAACYSLLLPSSKMAASASSSALAETCPSPTCRPQKPRPLSHDGSPEARWRRLAAEARRRRRRRRCWWSWGCPAGRPGEVSSGEERPGWCNEGLRDEQRAGARGDRAGGAARWVWERRGVSAWGEAEGLTMGIPLRQEEEGGLRGV